MHRNYPKKPHVFNDACMQVLPEFVVAKDGVLAKNVAVNALNSRPSHEFWGSEAFDKGTICQ